MDIEFNSLEELYNRLRPALLTKLSDLKANGYGYLKIEDIWNYLKENKWKSSHDLMLSDMVSDILNSDNALIDDYFKEKIDLGRMPKTDDEIILQTSKINQNIKNSLDQILDNRFSIENETTNDILKNLKVVGIVFNEKIDEYDSKIYISNLKIKELTSFINRIYSKTTILKNNTNSNAVIFPSENVEKGNAVVNESFGENLVGENLTINVNNIYCEKQLDLTINNIFTINNFQNYTGYSNYQLYTFGIFINNEDYENLYNLSNYQSSVFVKDINNIDKTILELTNIGIDTKKIEDFKVDEIKLEEQILKITKIIVTIVLIFILFLISYLVIRIVMKSRNSYYAILRTLGANDKLERKILFTELFLVSNLAYLITFLIINLLKTKFVMIEYINNLVKFIGLKEYILVYAVIFFIVIIVSIKIQRNIFKKTIISTFYEEEM